MEKRFKQFILLCFFMFSFFFCYSLPLIFFPIFAKTKHNLNEDLIGIIFSLFPFGHLCTASTTSKLIIKYPQNWILMLCSVILGLAMIGFGFLVYIQKYYEFIIVACVMRFLQGAAAGMYETICSMYIAILYPDNIVQKTAISQMMLLLGICGGSLIGSALYMSFNFQTSFFSVGLFYLIISPFALYMPRGVNDTSKEEGNKEINPENNPQNESIILLKKDEFKKLNGVFHFLCTPKILLTYLIMVLCFSSNILLLNNLSLNLKNIYKFKSVLKTALIYILSILPQMLFYIIFYNFGKKISRKKSLFYGGLILSIGMVLIGPEIYIFQKYYLSIRIIGLILLGIGLSCIFSVIFAELIFIGNNEFGPAYEIEIKSYSSTLFALGFSLGELIGSISGGYLVILLTLSHACSLCGIIIALELIIYLLVVRPFKEVFNCFGKENLQIIKNY